MRSFMSGLGALLLLPASMNLGWAAGPEASPAGVETCDALCRLQRYFTADHMVTQVPAATAEAIQPEIKPAASAAKTTVVPGSPKVRVGARKPQSSVVAAKSQAGQGTAVAAGSARLFLAPKAASPERVQPPTSRFASIIPGGAPTVGPRFTALRNDTPAP